MAIESQHYLFTFHPIKLHIYFCQICITQILHKLGYTHHCYSRISETNHLHEQTLNIDENFSISVSGIHEILLLFNKILKNDRQNDSSRL